MLELTLDLLVLLLDLPALELKLLVLLPEAIELLEELLEVVGERWVAGAGVVLTHRICFVLQCKSTEPGVNGA